MTHRLLGGLLGSVSLGVLCVGCFSEPDGGQRRAEQALAVDPASETNGSAQDQDDPVLDGENAGSTAVTLRWVQPENAANVAELRVLVQNTTDQPQAVQLVLTGTPPSRQEIIEQPFGQFVLNGRQTRVQKVSLSDIPVQSSVYPAGLRVVAQFSPAQGSPTLAPSISFTEPRLLAFDPSFKTAQLRTTEEQSRMDSAAPSLELLAAVPYEVRVRNPQTGAFVLADSVD